MIIVDNCIVTDDLLKAYFACDITKCKGICCVEGDAGAPLDESEVGVLEDIMEDVKPFLTKEGLEVIEQNGVFDYDQEGNLVTPLVKDRDCAFLIYDGDIAVCAIEKAWEQGLVDFQKPISCHLYPIRLSQRGQFTTLNYHKWFVCEDAVCKGKTEKIALLDFLKTPLIRKFGENWYQTMEKQLKLERKEK